MSAIPACSVSLKTMADGTLRMSFDIEPAHAKDAFALFSAPGTPVAIAALKQGYEAKSDAPDPQLNPMLGGVGPLCKWLVLRCKEPEFWAWIEDKTRSSGQMWGVKDEATAKRWVCKYLGIESRREIDESPAVEKFFHDHIRHPYQKWLVRRGVHA